MPSKLTHYKGVHYAPLEDPSEATKPPSSWLTRNKKAVLAGVVSLLLFTAAGTSYCFIFLGHSDDHHTQTEPFMNDCGKSSAEAMARGCKMEPLFYGWIPPQCYYPDLTAEFPVFADRTWYVDQAMTTAIPERDLMEGKHSSIWTRRFHTEHCLFMWRKLTLAVHERYEWVDNKTLSMWHAEHCTGDILEKDEGWNATNNAKLGTYKCMKMNWA
ncbi:hypothetical protein QBC47DRAFT_373522 [Echria macrotheca]|uniref:Uncharacterized protein n=1 Tax=Echria macrotheca TaxID=438768 RepID=A0AAJ0F8I2_9PEZI|nr:hypothetical protein QBC47DRAFT_373522 [Echria macrotheca]